ncbi:MAG: hypothetical protein QXL51_02530, partial [Candidatus Aenigmatarchaeota archaeon]
MNRSLKKGTILFLIGLFLVFLFNFKVKAWEIGVYLNATNGTDVTIDTPVSVSSEIDNVAGVFVENDTLEVLNLGVSSSVNATFSNETASGVAFGIYFNGTEGGDVVRPVGNLTVTSSGEVNVIAYGNGTQDSGLIAGGIIFGNGTNNTVITNQGSISVLSNATDGEADAIGIGGLRF